MRNVSFFTRLKLFRAVRAAAVALPVAFGFAVPAAAEPVFEYTDTITAPPGALVTVLAGHAFDNAGTNPRFTEAEFSDTDYYSEPGLSADGILSVQVKTAVELDALMSPPPSPFTVTVDVTMTNDEGDTATGMLTFETAYERVSASAPSQPDEPETAPIFSEAVIWHAPAGVLASASADRTFDNAGTNPRFTEAEFSTTEYFNIHQIYNGVLLVQAKTPAELNALPTPPSSPFRVTVDVTMTNDEGQTASGTITYQTSYDRDSASAPSQPGGQDKPTFSETIIRRAPAGVLASASADRTFDNAGTNPRFTEAEFSSTEYLNFHRIQNGVLFVQAKTSTELNALASPPPNPFGITVDVTMTNDEGQTASGTIRYQTTYQRDSAPEPPPPAVRTYSFRVVNALTQNTHPNTKIYIRCGTGGDWTAVPIGVSADKECRQPTAQTKVGETGVSPAGITIAGPIDR